MRRRVYWLLIALAILPVGAHAQTDWIDEFPSVTEVAHAAFEELKVTSAMSRLDMTGDDDSIAVNLAGTLNVLRQILYLKFIAEQPLPKAREDKLKKLVAAYLEAELTIGGGAGTRRGYITRAPSAGGQGCSAQDQACYRRWFLAHLHANTSRAEYRERFLNRLFPCGTLAKELNGLRQARAATMPYFPSPAVTLQTDGQLAGLAPAGCTAYGGDANQNGLCDDWERKPSLTELSASASSPSAPIVMDTVKLAQGGGLKVALAKWGGKLGQSVCFRVWRSDKSTVDASAQQIWGGPCPRRAHRRRQGKSASDRGQRSAVRARQGAAVFHRRADLGQIAGHCQLRDRVGSMAATPTSAEAAERLAWTLSVGGRGDASHRQAGAADDN